MGATVDNIISEVVVRARTEGLRAAAKEVDQIAGGLKGLQGIQAAQANAESKSWHQRKNDVKMYQNQMNNLGMMYKNQAQNSSMLIRNLQGVRRSLSDVSKVGGSTKGSIDALKAGQDRLGNTTLRNIGSYDKFRIMLGATRNGLMSLTQTYIGSMKNLQWTGRQLMVGITLPLIAVGNAAIRAFTTIESEYTRLRKVLTETQAEEIGIGISAGFENMQGSIDETFSVAAGTGYETEVNLGNVRDAVNELSIAYGTNQQIVTAVTADWAAMGYTAQDLIPAVDEVMRVAALGDVDVSVATKGLSNLINVFAKDIDNVQEKIAFAGDIVNQFNAIENATVLQMKELIESFPQAGEVARQFGLTAAGTAAALVAMKAAGFDATEGAHAIKFGLQRIINPTNKAREAAENIRDVNQEVGQTFLDVMDGAVRGQDALDQFAQSYMTLLGESSLTAQRFLSDLVGKRQAARLGSLFDQMNAGLLEYNTLIESGRAITADNVTNQWLKAMIASGEKGQKTLEEMNAELDESSRQELELKLEDPSLQIERLRVQLTALGHDFISAIWPTLQKVMDKLKELMDWFKNLSDRMKNMIAISAGLAAALGPLIFAFAQVGLAMGEVFHMFVRLLPKMGYYNQAMAEQAIKNGLNTKTLHQVGDAYVRNDSLLGKAVIGVQNYLKRVRGAGKALGGINLSKMGDAAEAGRVARKSIADQMFKRGGFSYATIMAESIKGGQQAHDAFIDGYSSRRKRFKTELKNTGKSIRDLLTAPFRGAAKVIFAPFRKPLAFITDKFKRLGGHMNNAFKSSKANGFFATLKKGFSKLPEMLMAGTSSLMAGVSAIAVGFSTILASVVAIGVALWIFLPALVGIVAFASSIQRHWSEIYAKMKPGIEDLKRSWEKFRDTMDDVVGKIMSFAGVSQQVGENSVWETIGRVMGSVLTKVGELLEWIGESLLEADNLWERMGGTIQYTVRAFQNFLEGNWKDAFADLGRAFEWGFILPAIEAIDWLVTKAVQGVALMLSAIGEAMIAFEGVSMEAPGWLKGAVNAVIPGASVAIEAAEFGFKEISQRAISEMGEVADAAGDELWNFRSRAGDEYRENLKDRAPVEQEYYREASEVAGKGGEDAADQFNEEAANELERNKEAAEAAAEAVQKWRPALKSALDEIVGKMVDDAMEALKESHEARLAVFDKQIEAIEAVEEKEKELLETQEYLDRKRKARDSFALSVENYKRSRALALYEGRIDDARALDSEMAVEAKEHKEEMKGIEDDRARELLNKEREEQKERIKNRKDALAEILKDEEQGFKDRLDLLTRYTPRNIAQVQNLINGISNLLGTYGVEQWSGAYTSAVGTWAKATELARADLEDQAYWSGEEAAQAFMDAVEGAADGGGGDGAAGSTGNKPWDLNREMGNTFKKAFRYSGRRNDRERQLYGVALQRIADEGWREQWKSYKNTLNRFFRSQRGSAQGGRGGTHAPGPQYHTGGDVPGIMPRNVPATLQSGEYVIQRDAAKALGSGALGMLNKAHTYHDGGAVGSVPNFDTGGWVDWAAGGSGFGGLWTRMYDAFMNEGGKIAGNTREELEALFVPITAMWGGELAAGIPEGLAIGPLASMLIGMFPGIGFSPTGGLLRAPGTLTSSGHPSDHGFGRAIDLAAPMTPAGIALMRRVFEHVVQNAAAYNLKQAIFEHDMWRDGKLMRGGWIWCWCPCGNNKGICQVANGKVWMGS
jgi:TP901 family phage tail tape measure protein